MPQILKFIIIVIAIIFLIYVLSKVRKRTLSIKHALIWILLSLGIITCVLSIPALTKIADLVGIETVSNMLFYIGFVFSIFISFNITQIISEQNDRIIKLTQELAILKKNLNDYKESNE